MDKQYRRLVATDKELVEAFKETGSMAGVARKFDVGYQSVAERFKRLKDQGLVLPKPGKPLSLSPDQVAELQAILSQG